MSKYLGYSSLNTDNRTAPLQYPSIAHLYLVQVRLLDWNASDSPARDVFGDWDGAAGADAAGGALSPTNITSPTPSEYDDDRASGVMIHSPGSLPHPNIPQPLEVLPYLEAQICLVQQTEAC